MRQQTQPDHALSHRIDRVVEITGASRTKVYEALKRGELEAVKFGRATLVLDASVRRWLASLPRYAA
jgi:excisionase family DNA binding protein